MKQFKEDNYYIKALYGAYQLDWMLSHGYSLSDLMDEMSGCVICHDEHIHNNDYTNNDEMRADISGIFYDWQDNYGFKEGIWSCYDEFCENELQDMSYIPQLIKGMSGIDTHEFLTWYNQYATRTEED